MEPKIQLDVINISIVIRSVDANSVRERLLPMATSKQCDALSLTNLVISELTNVGLSIKYSKSMLRQG